MPRTTLFRSTSTGASSCLRENASSCRTRSAPRPAVCRIIASRRACVGLFAQLAVQHLGIAADRRQQIVEVVRHARGQPADRRHGLCLAQPLLGLPPRRHVGVQRDEAAAGQRVAPDLELPAARAAAARSCPCWRRSAAAPCAARPRPRHRRDRTRRRPPAPRRISSIGRPTRRISAGTPVNSGNRWFHAISRRSPSTIMMPSLMPVSVALEDRALACQRLVAATRQRPARAAAAAPAARSAA